MRACTNGSRSARAKAGTSTLRFVPGWRCRERRPRRMQVLVRIPGSGSTCVLARSRRRSLFRIRSVSCWCSRKQVTSWIETKRVMLTLGAMRRMDLTVASRMTGTTSPKPVSCETSQVLPWYFTSVKNAHKVRPDAFSDILACEFVRELVEPFKQGHAHCAVRCGEHAD